MRRADLDDSVLDSASKAMVVSMNELETKVFGRIEPRKGSKPSPHPKTENRRRVTIYLDESGTSGDPVTVPVFTLAGVAVDPETAGDYIRRADDVKERHFGKSNFTFHEPNMRRSERDNKQGVDYSFNNNPALRMAFISDFRKLISETPFDLFGVAIRRKQYTEMFGDRPNPYLPAGEYETAIMMLMERYARYIGDMEKRSLAKICFESIGAREDAQRQFLFADLLVHGTEFVSQKHFRSWLDCGCEFETKSGSSIAEIADLAARDLFERTRSDFLMNPPFWDILLPRFWSAGDLLRGQSGFKVFPDYDIRELVMAERERAQKMRSAAG